MGASHIAPLSMSMSRQRLFPTPGATNPARMPAAPARQKAGVVDGVATDAALQGPAESKVKISRPTSAVQARLNDWPSGRVVQSRYD